MMFGIIILILFGAVFTFIGGVCVSNKDSRGFGAYIGAVGAVLLAGSAFLFHFEGNGVLESQTGDHCKLATNGIYEVVAQGTDGAGSVVAIVRNQEGKLYGVSIPARAEPLPKIFKQVLGTDKKPAYLQYPASGSQ